MFPVSVMVQSDEFQHLKMIASHPVGLDSEKRIFSEKMRKERKKRGKEAKR